MSWSVGTVVLMVTGVLFFVIVVTSFRSGPAARMGRRNVLAMGVAASVVTAMVLVLNAAHQYPPLVWLLPLVPTVVTAVMVHRRQGGNPQSPSASADAAATGHNAPCRAAFFPTGGALASPGEGGDGAARERACDPLATAHDLADIAFSFPQLRATVARHPATSAAVLEWLAAQGDPVLHAAIASRSAARHARSFA